jgi:hypothetical protein
MYDLKPNDPLFFCTFFLLVSFESLPPLLGPSQKLAIPAAPLTISNPSLQPPHFPVHSHSFV